MNIKIRFKNTKLGFLWSGIEPLLYFIVLYTVFTSLRLKSEDFAIYLITGVMIYHIFVRGTTGGITSLTGNGNIIKSFNIKKEFFPVVSTTAVGILAFVDIGIFFGLMPFFQFTPTWSIILLPIPMLLLIILILGFSYLLSVANVFLRDIYYIWIILMHVLLFVSPIFWNLEDGNQLLHTIHQINPVGQIIEISHNLVINGVIPPIQEWAYTTLYVFVIFFVGFYLFKKFEDHTVEKL